MIVDQLSNIPSDFYAGLLTKHNGAFPLADRLMTAFRFLQRSDLASLAPSRIDLDGDRVYAMVQHYNSKPRAEGKWEAHRKYIDVQYVVEGEELMGYANLSHLKASPYNDEKDFLLLEGEGSFVYMPAGTFFILAPQDAHIPGVAVNDQPSSVKKVVVKVQIA